jgi:hypothetical protein
MAKVGKKDSGKANNTARKNVKAALVKSKGKATAAVAKAARLPGKTSAAQKLKNAQANKKTLGKRSARNGSSKGTNASGSPA